MGGCSPLWGRAGSHRPRPGVQARIACKELARQAGRRRRKRAGSFQARHSQRIPCQPHRNAGQAKRVPSPASPSPQCHTAAAQAPRHHRGSAGAARRVIYSHQLPGHFSLRQDHV